MALWTSRLGRSLQPVVAATLSLSLMLGGVADAATRKAPAKSSVSDRERAPGKLPPPRSRGKKPEKAPPQKAAPKTEAKAKPKGSEPAVVLAGADGPLSDADAARYREAFAAAERGSFDAAEAAVAKARDRSLEGHVLFVKLMHPTAYKASYQDLAGWLNDYADLGGAERVYALAAKRKPAGAALPKAPPFLAASRDWTRIDLAETSSGDRSFAARDAYYSGFVEKAYALAPSAGEPWIAGLAAWRLGRVDEARRFFLQVAEDDSNDDWLRAAAWFWTARCAERTGDAGAANGYFRRAAAAPYTFYGLIAARKLELGGVAPGLVEKTAFRPAPAPAAEEPAQLIRVSTAPGSAAAKRADALVARDARARRAAALAQIGRTVEAAAELRAGLALAKSDSSEREWQGLVLTLNVPLQAAAAPPPPRSRGKARPYRAEPFETPDLYPDGGWTLDKALVYALVRQESRFNPFAVSPAGAVGLMQVRPEAAADSSGDDYYLKNVFPLFDAPTNLRVGQDYWTWLIEKGLGGGPDAWDLFRAIAAYNGGPGAVIKTRKRVDPNADALLFIESLPARETRDYVEKVAFNYWTYRKAFGQTTPTLDAAARYERIVDMRLDF